MCDFCWETGARMKEHSFTWRSPLSPNSIFQGGLARRGPIMATGGLGSVIKLSQHSNI